MSLPFADLHKSFLWAFLPDRLSTLNEQLHVQLQGQKIFSHSGSNFYRHKSIAPPVLICKGTMHWLSDLGKLKQVFRAYILGGRVFSRCSKPSYMWTTACQWDFCQPRTGDLLNIALILRLLVSFFWLIPAVSCNVTGHVAALQAHSAVCTVFSVSTHPLFT